MQRTLNDTQDWFCTKCRNLKKAQEYIKEFQREYNALIDLRTNNRKEIEIRDQLIGRLEQRNQMLETCLKKSIKIMKNPTVLKEAFKKFNLERFVYNSDSME